MRLAATGEQLICPSEALRDGGDGVRFTIKRDGADVSAFVVRYAGVVHGYVNRCSHRSVELDWDHGRFFDHESRYLICATHGALYAPDTGRCVGAPCNGGLVKLPVIEKNNAVYFIDTV
ncbi:MAG: Rieske (2Fe-2S) protein [Sulfurifustaceae bacterium]